MCLMYSFLEGLCERGVKVRCEARDCFHLIVHLVNCFLFSLVQLDATKLELNFNRGQNLICQAQLMI